MLKFRRRAGLIVKTMDPGLRMRVAPADDLPGVTVVQQINEREVAGGIGVQAEKLLPQDRRADEDAFGRQIRRLVKRQRQLGRPARRAASV